MECKICGNRNLKTIYSGKVRNGGLGQYTDMDIPVYQCTDCGVIWHENVLDNTDEYYESTEYRDSLEGSSKEEQFYCLHDKETLEKFKYTGTEIFRNKIVADVGCGCGAFLDFIYGVANSVIAVEPSKVYRQVMDRKGFHTYPYLNTAISEYGNQVDVVTSFDVIEHVEDPQGFLEDIYKLLSIGGKAIIGTPTDAPVMRQLLGQVYEKKLLFSTQHLWVFSDKNLKIIADRCGFKKVETKYFQRYGLENMLGWVKNKEPNSEVNSIIITETMNNVWKSQCCENKISDYVVLYLEK